MVESSCILQRRSSETIFRGDRPTVSTSLSLELFPEELEHVRRIAHINNLYNTAFWALVQEGKQTTTQAHEALRVSVTLRGGGVVVLTRGGKGTNSAQKNQLLFERFGINYNDVHERMRKGSVIVREVGDPLLSVSSSADAR